MSQKSMDEMMALFKDALEEVGHPGWEHVHFSTDLASLELESVQFLRLIGIIEDELGVPLDEGLGDCETVRDLLQTIREMPQGLVY